MYHDSLQGSQQSFRDGLGNTTILYLLEDRIVAEMLFVFVRIIHRIMQTPAFFARQRALYDQFGHAR